MNGLLIILWIGVVCCDVVDCCAFGVNGYPCNYNAKPPLSMPNRFES